MTNNKTDSKKHFSLYEFMLQYKLYEKGMLYKGFVLSSNLNAIYHFLNAKHTAENSYYLNYTNTMGKN